MRRKIPVMMANRLANALLVTALSALARPAAPVAGQGPTEAHPAPRTYEALLSRLKARDRDIDFQELRFAYAESPGYDPYEQFPVLSTAMFSAIELGAFDQVFSAADSILKRNYVFPIAHVGASIALTERGDTAAAVWHANVFRRLVSSIIDDAGARPRRIRT